MNFNIKNRILNLVKKKQNNFSFFNAKLYVSIFFCFFLVSNVVAQNSKEIYQLAKESYENGENDVTITHLQNCQKLLGGSNAKIEALKCQALVAKEEWVNAGIAYNNYERLLPQSKHNGEAYTTMKEIKNVIWDELEKIEKKKKEELEKEIKEDLVLAEKKNEEQENEYNTKSKIINENNQQQLYQLAMQTKDKELLDFYKEEVGSNNENYEKVNKEIEKINNPTLFLDKALNNDDLDDFKYLLSIGADINWVNSDKESLLHIAVIKNSTSIFNYLVSNKIGLEEVDSYGNTVLIRAILQNKINYVNTLLRNGSDPLKVNSITLQPPLYFALHRDFSNIGEALIKSGANPNEMILIDGEKMTPLYISVTKKKSIEFSDVLINNGANVNGFSENNLSPLMGAVNQEDLLFVNYLLGHGADINLQGKEKQTALHLAVENKNSKMVEYLIQRGGADKKFKDSNNNTPLELSKESKNKEISKIIRKSKSLIDITSDYHLHESQYLNAVDKIEKRKNRIEEVRGVNFFGFKVGYIMPMSADSKGVPELPEYINSSTSHFPSEEEPFAFPYAKGKFGLKNGFSAGFTGITSLEFINRNMPNRIGFGIPMELNVAVMQYDWESLGDKLGSNSFLYTSSDYKMWGVGTFGIGLSMSIRATDYLFFDFIARPEFYLTTGGMYKIKGTNGIKEYDVQTVRDDVQLGFNRAFGVNLRYRKLYLGFDIRQGIKDKQPFKERVGVRDVNSANSSWSVTEYQVKANNGLKLDYMQLSLGINFN